MFSFNFLNIGGDKFQESVDKRMQKTIVPIFAMRLPLSPKRHDPWTRHLISCCPHLPRMSKACRILQCGALRKTSLAYFKSTTATLFTPLHDRYSLRSGVATMLRTTPPPDGICFALKVSDLGSNLTKVLGVTPDSLYQRYHRS